MEPVAHKVADTPVTIQYAAFSGAEGRLVWRERTFASQAALERWYDKNVDDIYDIRFLAV